MGIRMGWDLEALLVSSSRTVASFCDQDLPWLENGISIGLSGEV